MSTLLFKDNTSPLEEVKITDTKIGDTYITNTGTRVKKTDDINYEIIKGSELIDGELVTDLTPKQLDLFWKLMRNREHATD